MVANNALVVDGGDMGRRVTYADRRSGGSEGLGLGGDRGARGGRSVDMFAPSHPQAVNQYVREYVYRDQPQQPAYDYSKTLQQYYQSFARKYRILTTNRW